MNKEHDIAPPKQSGGTKVVAHREGDQRAVPEGDTALDDLRKSQEAQKAPSPDGDLSAPAPAALPTNRGVAGREGVVPPAGGWPVNQ